MRLPGFLARMRPETRTLTMLVGVVAVMVSLSFAAVPFYRWFCQVTGYGGTTAVSEAGSDVILDRTIKIRFDASLEAGMPWEFRPVQREMEVRIGETNLAFYEAYNPTGRAVAGTAGFNVSPDAAGGYFTKIDCFCFTQQVLAPGERVEMPVVFFVDPALLEDRDAGRIRNITLSYTFYQTELPKEQASLSPATAASYN